MAEEPGTTLAKKDGALKGAALSAAVGVAVWGLRKALAGSGAGLSLHQADEDDGGENGGLRIGSLLTGAAESASDSLLPLAESAAAEAGRWVARNSPELIRDRLLPRFIDAFRKAA